MSAAVRGNRVREPWKERKRIEESARDAPVGRALVDDAGPKRFGMSSPRFLLVRLRRRERGKEMVSASAYKVVD